MRKFSKLVKPKAALPVSARSDDLVTGATWRDQVVSPAHAQRRFSLNV
jgi:hypothetical protein